MLYTWNNLFGLWCNGNTTVFGAVIVGSNPTRPTIINIITMTKELWKELEKDINTFISIAARRNNCNNNDVIAVMGSIVKHINNKQTSLRGSYKF